MSNRTEQLAEEIRKHASMFIVSEATQASLLTVTNVHLSSDLKKVDIFITVLPESKENSAIDFLKRKTEDLRDILKKKIRSLRTPKVFFHIDYGEKNRQKIDEISREK